MVTFKFDLQASWRKLEFLVAPRRIGFPAAAGRTVPVELPRLESAVLAMVARQALRMAVYEIADELQVVAPFDGRDQELRLEQLVQAEQGLVAAQLVLHQLVRRLGALRVERRLEGDIEQVERRKARQVAAQQREPFLGAPDRAVALEQALRDEREISRVLLLDALPGLDGAVVIARGRGDVAQDDVGAYAFAVCGEGRLQVVPRPFRARMRRFHERELAIVIRDLLLRGLPGVFLQLERDPDGLHPVLLLLVDLEQEFQRLGAVRRALELGKHLLRAVEEPGLQVVLPQLDHRVQALLPAQIGTLEQVAVHADRALGLAAAAEQAPQREVQLDGLRVDLDHLDEGLDRLVRLLVQQEIEAFEIRARQLPRFREQLLDVDARREPAQPEEQGEPEQPPELEVHGIPGLGLRRQSALAASPQLALELLDLAALPEQPRQAREDPDPRAEGEKKEQGHDHRGLPGLAEEEAQLHRIGIHEREGEYGEEQERPQQPRQVSEELHLTLTTELQSKRRHLVDAAVRTPPAQAPIFDRPSRAVPCRP